MLKTINCAFYIRSLLQNFLLVGCGEIQPQKFKPRFCNQIFVQNKQRIAIGTIKKILGEKKTTLLDTAFLVRIDLTVP